MRLLSAVTTIALVLQSCATLGPRTAGTSDSKSGNSSGNSSNGSNNSSGNSNNSSANSSGNSGNSTGNSGRSSESSNNTSYHSNNSSQGSRHSSDSNASSRDSSNNTTDDPDVQNFSVALAGSALLITTGVAVGLILYFALRKTPREPSKLQDDAGPAAAWLRANKRQLQADLALGAGPTLEDLASAAEIRPANLPRFCALLAAHRSELLAPLRGAGDVSLETAVQVMSRVGELTIADPVLRADADAFLERHPEG